MTVAGYWTVVDMTGRTLAGVEVLSRGANIDGCSSWKCRHVACGHESSHLGIKLRSAEKKGARVRCPICTPTRKGRAR